MNYSQYESEIYAKLQPLGDPTRTAFMYGRQGRKTSPATWSTLSTWSGHVENWAHSDSLASIYSYLLAQNFDEVYLREIAFGAATKRFSEAERGAFIERRKAIRAQSGMVSNRLEVSREIV